MIHNHKKEHPYNYDYLNREAKYAVAHLKLIVDELEGDPHKFIQRTINDLQRAINHTEHNLKNIQDAENSPQNT